MLLVNSAELVRLTRRVSGFRGGGRGRRRRVAATVEATKSTLASSPRTTVARLKFETVTLIEAADAAALALSGMLAGGVQALVGGVAGTVLSGVPAPGMRALGAALVVAVQQGRHDGGQ